MGDSEVRSLHVETLLNQHKRFSTGAAPLNLWFIHRITGLGWEWGRKGVY